jgi:hypothetical protein
VRVEAPSALPKRVVGQALAAREGRLRLKLEDGRELDLPSADIRQLELSRGQRLQIGKWAAIGALAGTTIMLGTLIASRGICDEDLGGCAPYGYFAAIGAVSGAAIGALVPTGEDGRLGEVTLARQAALCVGPAPGRGVVVRLSVAF